MTAAVIIPVRYHSTRFPGKPLAPLKGKPMVQHVYENSSGSRLATRVVVATDSEEILSAVLAFGGEAVMTAESHASGTDRVWEAASKMDCDIIVNVQGDEPLIRAEMVDSVISLLQGDGRASIGTLVKKTTSPEDMLNPNVVKAVFDPEGFALYFSRSPIPYYRDQWGAVSEVGGAEFIAYKHIGIYSYRREALQRLSNTGPTALEQAERLEQLRALETGLKIKVVETDFDTFGVDTMEDLERVQKCLNTSS